MDAGVQEIGAIVDKPSISGRYMLKNPKMPFINELLDCLPILL
jgi:hypothetical protein